MAIEAPRLLGVADGLFRHLSHITDIRNSIRARMAAAADPLVDYVSLVRAVDIDAAIRAWSPRWPPGDSRDRVAPLYKQMMWVYLFRTIYPPPASPPRRSTVGALPSPMLPSPPPPPPLATAPQRRASTGSPSAPQWLGLAALPAAAAGRGARAAAGHARVVPAVGPVADAAADAVPGHRHVVLRAAVRLVRAYTGLRNCDRVAQVLERVWALMDEGDWLAVWDWQGVARRMGLDCLRLRRALPTPLSPSPPTTVRPARVRGAVSPSTRPGKGGEGVWLCWSRRELVDAGDTLCIEKQSI